MSGLQKAPESLTSLGRHVKADADTTDTSLRDDFRAYVSELLPRFVSLLADAERTGVYDMVRPALCCLEALGSAVEEHLHLLLPSLVR